MLAPTMFSGSRQNRQLKPTVPLSWMLVIASRSKGATHMVENRRCYFVVHDQRLYGLDEKMTSLYIKKKKLSKNEMAII